MVYLEEDMTPFFSIILPCKNSIRTIERTIKSVLSQTVSLELIIVDGASTDGTLEFIQTCLADERVRLDSQSDTGIYAAINRGIHAARGRYIGVLNSDDAYLEGVLETVQKELQKGFDFLYAPVYWKNQKTHEEILICPIPHAVWLKEGLQQMPSPHVGVFLSKIGYECMGEYDETLSIAADHEYLLRIAKSRYTGIALDIPVAELLSGGVSASVRAKWQSYQVAQRNGRGFAWGFFIFTRQCITSLLIQLLPQRLLKELLKKSRFQVGHYG